MKRLLLFIPFFYCIACTAVTSAPLPEIEVPTDYGTTAKPLAVPVSAQWWQHFENKELTTLLATALSANTDIAASLARIRQAQALLRIANATLYPTVGFGAGAASSSIRSSGSSATEDALRSNLALSYEVDLFGKNRAAIASSQEAYRATVFDSEALALLVVSNVVTSYGSVLSLRERLAVADDNLRSVNEILKIVAAQHKAGRISELELSQQKSVYSTAQAARTRIQEQLINAENALNVLLGKAPRSTSIQETALASLEIPEIASGIPSELLQRRPDIGAAEARLEAARADIAVARAQFFPTLTIDAGWSIAAAGLSDPSTTILSAASALTAPIFQGGRLQGQLDQSKAREEELIENYKRTILVALQEVQDALAAVSSAQDREKSLKEAQKQAETAYSLSQKLYDAGSINFLTLIDTQRTYLNSRDSYIQARYDRVLAATSLFRALGGGWNLDQANAVLAAGYATF